LESTYVPQYGADSPCEVSAQIIDALSNHSNLESLTLSHSHAKWSRRGFAALARFLPSASKLKDLDLSGEGWNDEGANAVSAALAGNETLKKILFDDNDEIKSAGWKGFSPYSPITQPLWTRTIPTTRFSSC